MRKVLLSLAAALACSGALATPVLANEGRIEGRGGVIWDQGDSHAIAGVAAGYDFDLGTSAFAGPEVSADKILTDNTRVSFGFGGRAGVKTSEAGKLYAVGSYQTKPCRTCEHSWSAGAGYQHSFGSNLYGKVEYRHYFADNGVSDPDAVAAGLGVKF
jgi:opacity protein-like surface antigen